MLTGKTYNHASSDWTDMLLNVNFPIELRRAESSKRPLPLDAPIAYVYPLVTILKVIFFGSLFGHLITYRVLLTIAGPLLVMPIGIRQVISAVFKT